MGGAVGSCSSDVACYQNMGSNFSLGREPALNLCFTPENPALRDKSYGPLCERPGEIKPCAQQDSKLPYSSESPSRVFTSLPLSDARMKGPESGGGSREAEQPQVPAAATVGQCRSVQRGRRRGRESGAGGCLSLGVCEFK